MQSETPTQPRPDQNVESNRNPVSEGYIFISLLYLFNLLNFVQFGVVTELRTSRVNSAVICGDVSREFVKFAKLKLIFKLMTAMSLPKYVELMS